MMAKNDKLLLVIVFISIAITLLIYGSLPSEIPSHWNIKGEIDAYSSKLFSLLTAFLPLGILLLMTYLPLVDPKRAHYLQHHRAYAMIRMALVAFFLLLHWIIIFSALGYALSMARLMPLGIGILFFIIGRFMGQIQPNYTLGIRTPWTMADEEIWRKTHRVGGYAFMLSGLVFILAGIINQPYSFMIAIASIFVLIFYVFIYSYLEYKKTKKS